nr:immunoglobulin heavy chain junction region [Macaca mulatta]MOY25089.1 immunoglobulin heavy chain junction region [Macaca mulatta]MOY25737.1 immunoglobulin heavy chain junction region [Macaca mulatta]MOY26281.1 immunoglobulin heavy chain junction region [Macaca mulatta]MOY27897.1 immunoglobulin heavy chain junction region [Macaca mulatta]
CARAGWGFFDYW